MNKLLTIIICLFFFSAHSQHQYEIGYKISDIYGLQHENFEFIISPSDKFECSLLQIKNKSKIQVNCRLKPLFVEIETLSKGLPPNIYFDNKKFQLLAKDLWRPQMIYLNPISLDKEPDLKVESIKLIKYSVDYLYKSTLDKLSSFNQRCSIVASLRLDNPELTDIDLKTISKLMESEYAMYSKGSCQVPHKNTIALIEKVDNLIQENVTNLNQTNLSLATKNMRDVNNHQYQTLARINAMCKNNFYKDEDKYWCFSKTYDFFRNLETTELQNLALSFTGTTEEAMIFNITQYFNNTYISSKRTDISIEGLNYIIGLLDQPIVWENEQKRIEELTFFKAYQNR